MTSKKLIGLMDKADDIHDKYQNICKDIAHEADKILSKTSIYERLISDISCGHIGGDGLLLTLELDDGYAPHTIPCTVFFKFMENHRDLDYSDLVSLSI